MQRGDLILTADFDVIKGEGLDTIIPVIICNTDEFKEVEALAGKEVNVGDDVLRVSPK